MYEGDEQDDWGATRLGGVAGKESHTGEERGQGR